MVPPDCKCRSDFPVLFCPIILKEGKTCGAMVIFTMIVDTGFQIPVYSADALHGAGPALSDPFYPYDP